MDIQKRLISPCASFSPENDEVTVDIGALIRRIILFDTYLLQSIRLKEIPQFIKIFGFEGTIELLLSSVLLIHLDPTTIGQTGQTAILESRKKKGVLPLGAYSFSVIKAHAYNDYLMSCIDKIFIGGEFSSKQKALLSEAIIKANVTKFQESGYESIKTLKRDLVTNNQLIRSIISKEISKTINRYVSGEGFSLKIYQIDEEDFKVDSDLGRYGFSENENHKLIERSFLTLGGMNQRIEEMSAYRALSGFIGTELPIFEEKLDFLANIISPHMREKEMRRILEIKGFPDINPHDSSIRVDVNKLLSIRDRRECIEFRNWLRTTENLSDEEIISQIGNIKPFLIDILNSGSFRIIRFMISATLGLLNPIVGVTSSFIDTFIIEKILPISGPMAFISSHYPSIFK